MNASPEKPQLARFTSDNHIIKDHHYYAGNDFRWNMPAAIGPKFYPYYHQQKNENEVYINELKQQEAQDKLMLDDFQRKELMRKKAETLARYAERVKERQIIERMSKTPSIGTLDAVDNDDNRELCNIVAKRVNSLKGRRSNEISWNYLDKASPKRIKNYVNPVMLRGEENALKEIQKRIEKEEDEIQEKERRKSEVRVKLRQSIIDKHDKTFELEKKINTFSVRNAKNLEKSRSSTALHEPGSPVILMKARPSIDADSPINLERLKSSFEADLPVSLVKLRPSISVVENGSLASITRELKIKFPNTAALPHLSRKSSQSFGSVHLLKTKNEMNNDLQRVMNRAQTEIKGMLIQNMERGVYHSENPFHKSLADGSPVFKELLEENLKAKPTGASFTRQPSSVKFEEPKSYSHIRLSSIPSERQSSPLMSPEKSHRRQKSVIKLRAVEADKGVFDEIDSFERTFSTTFKSRGYGKVVLQQANTVCTEIGITSPLDLRKKRASQINL